MCFGRNKSPEIPHADHVRRRFHTNQTEIDSQIHDERRELFKRIARLMKDEKKRTFETSVVVETAAQKKLYLEAVEKLRAAKYQVHVSDRIYRLNGRNTKVLEWFF